MDYVEPFRHHADDGSIYAVEITELETLGNWEPYRVDLVRGYVDAYGLGREQRLTLAQRGSWMEAEEVQVEVETRMAQAGLDGLTDAERQTEAQPPQDEIFYMTAAYPPEAREGEELVVAQMLAVDGDRLVEAPFAEGDRASIEPAVALVDQTLAEAGENAALATAAREATHNGLGTPLTPLFAPDDPVRHVDGGGTEHWFGVAPVAETDSAHELRYFRQLTDDAGEVHRDSYSVMPLVGDEASVAWPLQGLEMYLEKGDVYMAQQFAHDIADTYGQRFPAPHDLPALDPRPDYYFGLSIGPNNDPAVEAVKTWMDGAERRFDTLTVGEYGSFDEAAVDERELETLLQTEGLEVAMNLAESMAEVSGYLDPDRDDPRIFFEENAPVDPFYTKREQALARPGYSIGAISANGASFLDVMKTWGEDDYERLVIPQPDWDTARQIALSANALVENEQLVDAMHLIEQEGVAAGVVDPNRADPRLFRDGPPDAFETQREAEINDDLARHGVTWAEANTWELAASPEAVDPPPYWRFDQRETVTPDGEPLGVALFMTVFPDVADGQPLPTDETTRVQQLEMAHFEKPEAANRFEADFRGYLMPGVLEGTELAESVAELEGMSGTWVEMTGRDMDALTNGEKTTIVRERADWHPYNPYAERDARIEAEGLYTDPLHPMTLDNEPNNDIDR